MTGALAAGNPANGVWVTVNSGGTLSGSGRCGEVRVKSGGTIKPEGGNLTVSNLVLYAGCTVYRDAGTTNRIVVSQAGSIADQQGLTIIGGSVTLGGTVAAGVYPLIEYSGMLNGSVTNLTVANPEAGATYSFSATNNLIEVTVQKSAGTRLSVF